MAETEESAPKRGAKSGYHHGDLRNALISAATELARQEGPDAVVLRAVARRVGVSPTAAYRHFQGQEELLYAVKVVGQEGMADRMERAVADIDPHDVQERLFALGRAYVHFALDEPGLFRSAFCHAAIPHAALGMEQGGDGQPQQGSWDFRSYGLLVDAVDALVAEGVLSPERRAGAEVVLWSVVHGLVMLILDGALSGLDQEVQDRLAQQAMSSVLRGLTS
ncbi:TetR/AcrR family transcriptional regulator [Streptomyces sp. NPDC005438]|uniref:TetR/AcrR family transcriptional regulator n=1 Tax=Streptomyces sp. NPDC005438 TaxID=3156880 RepID=UPI00339E7596